MVLISNAFISLFVFVVIFLRLIQSIEPEFQLADLQESVSAVVTNGRKVFVPPDTDAKQVKAPFHFSHDSVLLLP